jgi:hypothetical protein
MYGGSNVFDLRSGEIAAGYDARGPVMCEQRR